MGGSKKYNIAMIHHIDENASEKFLLRKLFFKNFYANLKKVDLVVVVSKFWGDFLKSKGIKNIKTIYNSYNLNNYSFFEKELDLLKKQLKLNPKKPTIYIGKNNLGKGINEILNNIDSSKYNLIATGKELVPNDKYKCVFLSDKDFSMLLKIADVVLAMSTMPEGWNRIAHEALLVKTPVIGSGSGGMQELLTNAGQYIVSDFSKLEIKIQKALKEKEELGAVGFDYVKNLNLEYFSKRALLSYFSSGKYLEGLDLLLEKLRKKYFIILSSIE